MERLHFELALTRGNCPLSMLSQVIEPLFTYFFIHCVIIMSAALQSLDLTNLSWFWITSWRNIVCLPSTTERVEMKIHPMELLLIIPGIGRHFRQAVCADVVAFPAWLTSITAQQKGKIKTLYVRQILQPGTRARLSPCTHFVVFLITLSMCCLG